MIEKEKGFFSAVLYSKITNRQDFDVYADNLESFFGNLRDRQLLKYVYFVDDSDSNTRDSIRMIISDLIIKNGFHFADGKSVPSTKREILAATDAFKELIFPC